MRVKHRPNGGRILSVDALRALSILYIVGLWHLVEYAPAIPSLRSPFTEYLTTVVLGVFVFVSGLLLGRRKTGVAGLDIKDFYRRRFMRIYPLYLLALAVFFAAGLVDWHTAMLSAFGLSMFFGPPPYTLWFVAMLLWFYLLAPLLISRAGQIRQFAVICVAVLCIFGFAELAFPQVDKRLFVYFPAFAAGVYCSSAQIESRPLFAFLSAAAVSLVTVASFSLNLGMASVVLSALVALFGAIAVYMSVDMLAPDLGNNRFLIFVSYASFAMYLFHRPILIWATKLFLPESGVWQATYLLCLCLPVVILTSWLIQKNYDKVISKC